MEIHLLGPVEVVAGDGRTIPVGAPMQRAVLAVLALDAGRVVPADRLADALWGEEPPPSASGTLRYHVSKLRDALEPASPLGRGVIATREPGYLLDLEPSAVDLHRFEGLCRQGRSSLGDDPAAAAELIRSALAMVHGPPLAEFEYREFAAPVIRRCEEMRLGALEDLMETELALGRHAAVVADLQSLVAEHPFRERLWRHLMVALAGSGRQAEALRAYQDARRVLGEELGIEPAGELREVEERVLMQDPTLLERSAAAPAPASLPTRMSSFVGREAEIAGLMAAVAGHRMVTVVGPPGMGKTRLAIETGSREAAAGRRVWFAALGERNTRHEVVDAIAGAFGIEEREGRVEGSPEERIRDFVRRKQGLLILDNCEQVLADAGAIAGLLLTAAPGLSVLATSRERLGIEGEHAWPLPPLEQGGDAVALFAERARAADPEFRLDDDSRPAVERICSRLGGQPLAIELAAALTIALSIGDIERHLDGRLLDAGGGRLRAAVEMSWDALDGGAATLLRRLAVCSEGFDLEMVEALGKDIPSPIGALEQLVGRSLVSTERRAGHLRYFLLETIRWFAADRLGASGDEDARGTHAREMTRRAAAWFREWLGGGLPWRALTRDAGNLRAAAAWAAGHDIALLQELAGFLGPLWEPLRAGDEGYRRTMEALAAGEPEDPESRARLLLAAVCTARRAGEVRAALDRADDIVEGFRACGNLHGMARALRIFGQSGEFFSVEGFADARRRAVEIAAGTGDRRLLAGSIDDYAWERWQAGDPEAVEQWRRAADLYRDLGDDASWAAAAAVRITAEHYLTDTAGTDPIDELLSLQEVVAGLGVSFSTSQIENELRIASEALGRLDDAIAHGRRAVEIADTLGDEPWWALCTVDLADLYRQTGDFAAAAAHLLDGAAHFRANERPGSCIWVVETIVQLLADTGDHEEAARLAGAARRLREDHRLTMPVWDEVTYRVAIDGLRRSLGSAEFDRLAEEGAGLPLLDALDRATGRVRRIL